jgi:hypothetical protein
LVAQRPVEEDDLGEVADEAIGAAVADAAQAAGELGSIQRVTRADLLGAIEIDAEIVVEMVNHGQRAKAGQGLVDFEDRTPAREEIAGEPIVADRKADRAARGGGGMVDEQPLTSDIRTALLPRRRRTPDEEERAAGFQIPGTSEAQRVPAGEAHAGMSAEEPRDAEGLGGGFRLLGAGGMVRAGPGGDPSCAVGDGSFTGEPQGAAVQQGGR